MAGCTVNHYEILSVPPDATYDQIKKRYHELVLKSHPDKSVISDCEVSFQEIDEAWKVLRDPVRRKAYDEDMRRMELEDYHLLYGEFKLKDMDYNEVAKMYSLVCKCGDIYTISASDVKENKSSLIGCDSCSLMIAVNIAPILLLFCWHTSNRKVPLLEYKKKIFKLRFGIPPMKTFENEKKLMNNQ